MKGRILQRNEVARRGMSFIGKIKVGEKNDRGLPTSLDYFKATGPFAPLFDQAYPVENGKKPNRIQVAFISNDLLSSCYEEVDGRDKDGRRAGYSPDGVVYYLWDAKEQDYFPTEDQAQIDTYTKKHNVRWATTLNLHFVIPKIRGVFGLWKFQTKGEHSSMPAIVETFDYVQSRIGTIVNFPFDLIVEKVKSQKPGSKSTFPVVTLVANFGEENMTTLRKYFEAGYDFRQVGVLNEAKLLQLGQAQAPALEAVTETQKDGWKDTIREYGTDSQKARARDAWKAEDWAQVKQIVEAIQAKVIEIDHTPPEPAKDLFDERPVTSLDVAATLAEDDTIRNHLDFIQQYGDEKDQQAALDLFNSEAPDKWDVLENQFIDVQMRLAREAEEAETQGGNLL